MRKKHFFINFKTKTKTSFNFNLKMGLSPSKSEGFLGDTTHKGDSPLSWDVESDMELVLSDTTVSSKANKVTSLWLIIWKQP